MMQTRPANEPKTEIDRVAWATYNAQGSKGGDAEAMSSAMSQLTISTEMRERVCSHIASKGFVSMAYIKACINSVLDSLGGNLRDVNSDKDPTDLKTPPWNDYAVFVQGAKFDKDEA